MNNVLRIKPPANGKDIRFIYDFYESLEHSDLIVDNWYMRDFWRIGGYFAWASFSIGLKRLSDTVSGGLNAGDISCCVLTYNNEDHIEACLKTAARLAREIIIIDSGSTDKTLDICGRYKAKVFSLPDCGDYSFNRNFGIRQCSYDWILMLDSDESISANLGDKLGEIIAYCDKKKIDVVWLPRLWISGASEKEAEYYAGHISLYPDPQARLLRRSAAPFYINSLHEWIRTAGGGLAAMISVSMGTIYHMKHILFSKKQLRQLCVTRKDNYGYGPERRQFFLDDKERRVSTNYMYEETMQIIKERNNA